MSGNVLIQGKRKSDRTIVEEVRTTNEGYIITHNNPEAEDAFGRVRVSNPFTVFDSKLITADKKELFWDESTVSGSGVTASTPTIGKPYVDILSTINTASNFVRQTFQRFNYQPGKSQLILMTGVLNLTGGGTGVQTYFGSLDDDNGIAFMYDEGTTKVVARSNDSGTPVDTETAQTDWNLDVMDGTGSPSNPSGILVDWTKAQIFVFDFQWLSVGRIRWGLEIGGILYYIHEQSQVNTSIIPWASTPNLPLRYQQITTGSSAASSARVICCSVISEGGADFTGTTQSEGTTGTINANTLGVFYALAGARLKDAHTGTTVSPVGVSVVALTKDPFEWQLRRNPTVAGSPTYADKADSALQTFVGDQAGNPSVNTVTGGTTIARGFGGSGQSDATSIRSKVILGEAIDGTKDTFVLCIRPLTVNMDAEGAMLWDEVV